MNKDIELIKNYLEMNGDTLVSDIEGLSGAYMMVINNRAGAKHTIIVAVQDGVVDELISTCTDDIVEFLICYIQRYCKFNKGGN